MDYDSYSDEDFEDDEDTKVSAGWVYKASYVVVAIDTHPLMFKPDETGRIPFRNCLEACLRILDSLIFVNDSKRWNPFAILLAKDDPFLVDFKANILESVKLLKSKLKLSDDELEDQYQRKGDCDLAEFFLQCKKTFHDIKAAYYKRILIYITNDQNPVKDAQSKFAAINEVKSFDASEISLEIIPTVEDFDFTVVYNEMLALLDRDPSRESQEEICVDVEGLEQKLSSVLLPKHNSSKVKFYPNKNDRNRYLTCFDIKLIQPKKLASVTLSSDGKPVIRKPRATRETLPTYALKFPSKSEIDVVLEQYEKEQLYDVSFQRGYTLMYISKPILKPMYHLSQPHLLQSHSNEKTNFFNKFWQYCVNNDRVLVCVVKYKQPSAINFCELSPLVVGNLNSFLCKCIPYGSDINMYPNYLTPKVEVDDEKMKLVRQLVDKLTIDYHPSMFPDLRYRKKMAYVKSKLLDEPFEDDFKLFDKSTLDDRISKEVKNIKDAFGLEFNSDKGKRKRPTAQKASSRKKKN